MPSGERLLELNITVSECCFLSFDALLHQMNQAVFDWIILYTSLWRSDKLTCSCIGISFMDGFVWNKYAFTEWAQLTSCILSDPITKLPKATVRLEGLVNTFSTRNQLTNVLLLIPFENLSWKHFLCVFYLPAMRMVALSQPSINSVQKVSFRQ